MSDLERALEQLSANGASVATHAADVGLGVAFHRALVGARRFANLTSPETIEKGAKAMFLHKPSGRGAWDDQAGWVRNWYREQTEAVLRAVEEGKT